MKTNPIKMKIIFMLSAMCIIFGANAQHNPNHDQDPAKGAKKQTEWMKTELSLSDDQAAKVESINLTYAQKRKELREQMHKQMKGLEEDKNKELTTVLTKEQISKYESKKSEMRDQRKQQHMKKKEGCQKKCEGKKKVIFFLSC
jgi:hypothetical protein